MSTKTQKISRSEAGANVTASSHTNKNAVSDEAADSKTVWITDRLWISGLVGALSVVLIAVWYNQAGILQNGVSFFGFTITTDRLDSLLFALSLSTFSMLAAEAIRLIWIQGKHFISISPLLKSNNYVGFIGECVLHYLTYLLLVWLVISFFHTAGEYGFARNAAYYKAWFRFLELLWMAMVWGAFPYILITRALKNNKEADKKDPAAHVLGWAQWLLFKLLGITKEKRSFDGMDKKIVLSILVKLFFAPLMTVFFVDQFPHLVNNVNYLFSGIPNALSNGQYAHVQFNRDLFNISVALIFSIDVALAWCGYVISSRWVENQTQSAEPTLLGWVVCICCYPPFQMVLGLYYASPNERAILNFSQPWLVSVFTVMMVASYLIYMLSTLWFGVRFSNLTNRGIIRKGPYAWVRHPAYASKNFAWWCVMFPVVIITAGKIGITAAVMQILGLILMTWFYYMRANTEERHLMADPDYQAYCKEVPYRFIPKII